MEKSAQQASREKNAYTTTEEIYQGKIITVSRRTYHLSKTKSWDLVLHPGAVAIIPVTKNQEFLLVKQWRRAIEKITLEFPAGVLETQEEPLQCAERELREEVGMRANRMVPIGGLFSTPGFCSEYLHLFIALDLEESPLQPDEDEEIDCVTLSSKQLSEMIQEHLIEDAKTIAGFYLYEQWLKNQKT